MRLTLITQQWYKHERNNAKGPYKTQCGWYNYDDLIDAPMSSIKWDVSDISLDLLYIYKFKGPGHTPAPVRCLSPL
jgi:hypothetical protein